MASSKSKYIFSKEELDGLTNTFSDVEIAEKYNVWSSWVARSRKQFNIQTYSQKTGLIRMNGQSVSRAEIASSRLESMTQLAVAKTRGNPAPLSRRYSLNEDFFESIDSEEKAYVLGFILADGCVYKDGRTIAIAIKQTDKQILDDISKAVEYSGEVKFLPRKEGDGYGGDHRVRLRLNSVKLVQDIQKLGIHPAKTFTARLPVIPKDLECHLIRGLWDGDGHIGRSTSSLVGNLDLMVDVVKCLAEHGLPSPILEPLKTIYRLRLRKEHRSILNWCYGCNPKIVLDRKYANYLVF